MQELIGSILLVLSLIALWAFFFFVRRSYWINFTRHELFRIRNQLFDEAATGVLNFNDEAYGLVRTTINGMIQFTHEINLMQMVTSYTVFRFGYKKEAVAQFEAQRMISFKELSKEGRQAALSALAEAHAIILLHIINTSFLLFLTLKPIIAILRIKHQFKKFMKQYKSLWRIFDTVANQIGHTTQANHA